MTQISWDKKENSKELDLNKPELDLRNFLKVIFVSHSLLRFVCVPRT